ncbi:MAG: hypothetical protein ACXU8U_10120 [Asticcacaulis sp.]
MDMAGLAVTVSICLAALAFGGVREQRGALLSLAWRVIVMGAMVYRLDMMWAHLGADVLCLMGFIILGWKAPQPWPLWAGAFEVAALITDINRLCGYPASSSAYALLGGVFAGGVLLSLLAGTIVAIREARAQIST